MAENPNRCSHQRETVAVPLSEDERNTLVAQIRKTVSGFALSYTWLICRLSDEGLFTDKFEMSAVLSGTRRGRKADEILNRSLDILNEYSERMSFNERA